MRMSDKANIDVSPAGSIVMILLIIAVGLLLTSFYRRYKRAASKQDERTAD